MDELLFGQARNSPELKVIIGQVSYLIGESAGPTPEALQAYEEAVEARRAVHGDTTV